MRVTFHDACAIPLRCSYCGLPQSVIRSANGCDLNLKIDYCNNVKDKKILLMMSSCVEEEKVYVNGSSKAPATATAAPIGRLMKAGYLCKQGKLYYGIRIDNYYTKLH